MIEGSVTRRELLRTGSVLAGGAWLASALPLPRAARAAAASQERAVLTALEWQTLEAITARILPTDHEPGAKEAGCVNFIDKALANEEAATRPLYAAGLAVVDGAARALGAPGYAALPAEAQDAVLEKIEAGTLEGWPAEAPPSPLFFELVRAHTLIGFLADPKYGGNRDYAGWRVTRYPGPRHRRGGYSAEQVRGEAKVRTVWGSEQ